MRTEIFEMVEKLVEYRLTGMRLSDLQDYARDAMWDHYEILEEGDIIEEYNQELGDKDEQGSN